MPMVLFCVRVAMCQIERDRKFIIENPQASQMWNLPKILDLMHYEGVTWGTLDMCMYGLKHPDKNEYHRKATSLMHNFEPGQLDPMFIRCDTSHSHVTL